MSEAWAIEVDGLGKRFMIGTRRPGPSTIGRQVTSAIGTATRRVRYAGHDGVVPKPFWALRDVSFRLPPGGSLAIIGHNGAGKSTLLRILSGLTIPTEGRAVVRGRVASLLDVGAGFHNELTGRENVELKGVLLGMTRREVRRRTPEIIEWAGLEEFADTPVKRYSSGMRVRLAFSVTLTIDPEVVFLDEVLAVGDKAFRQRSSERIHVMLEQGRTLLFVSHSPGAIRSLCERTIRMDHGRLVDDGPTEDVLNRYLAESET